MFRGFFGIVAASVCALLLCNSLADATTLAELRETVKPLRAGCARYVGGVEKSLLDGLDKGVMPPDHQLQCYLRCVMIYLRTMKNGVLVPEVFMAQVKSGMPKSMQDGVLMAARYCYSHMVTDPDECVTAYNLVKCQYEQDPENFFFP